MADKVGIRFKSCGKIYFFERGGVDLKRGDSVVVESSFGVTIGRVVTEVIPVENGDREMKKVLRKATEEDFGCRQENEELEREARSYCLERIRARGLQMKLVCTEATLDKKRIIFYFTADGRIDFRELVKDLASKFKTRIEMRQIGVRDETKLLGGIGVCGRMVCCRTFLTGFAPISIKMAKKQELVLNTSKLSGLCGRLMCCLNYELDDRGRRKDSRADTAVPAETAVADESYLGAEEMKEDAVRETEPKADRMPKPDAGTPASVPVTGPPAEAGKDQAGQPAAAGQEGAGQQAEGRRKRKRGRRYRRFRKKKKKQE